MSSLLYVGLIVGVMYLFWRNLLKGGGPAASVLAFGRSRGRVMQEGEPRTTFDDVAGVEEAKEELLEVVDFLKRPERYTRLGAKIPKGVLLIGPPGTGKTLLARAVAGEAEVPFISISGSEFVEMLVGVGAARVRDLFRQARENSPCIVFIDELDALGRSRGITPGSNEEREQALNQLLVEMDGFNPNDALILMAATNRPEILDTALLRPGRFDRQVLVDVPDRKGRLAILEVHAKNVPLADEVELMEVAARTPGFAGADLANLVNEAAILSARRDLKTVDMKAFSDAIDRVVAGLEKKNRILSDDDKRRVAYHEVGHALAGLLAGEENKIHKISIVPRGMAGLGFTWSLPTEDKYVITREALIATLIALLGGRAAEEVVYGDPSTGAQSDLQKATELARSMVVDYGMSDEVGPVSVRAGRKPMFVGGEDGVRMSLRTTGQDLADTIDREVRRIVDGALSSAKDLLERNRPSLEEITAKLIESELLEGDQLKTLLAAAKEAHSQNSH